MVGEAEQLHWTNIHRIPKSSKVHNFLIGIKVEMVNPFKLDSLPVLLSALPDPISNRFIAINLNKHFLQAHTT
jgi:hypothetical protein